MLSGTGRAVGAERGSPHGLGPSRTHFWLPRGSLLPWAQARLIPGEGPPSVGARSLPAVPATLIELFGVLAAPRAPEAGSVNDAPL